MKYLYFIRIKKHDEEVSCFIALCDKTRVLKVITEFWPMYNPDEYEIIIELMKE